jgi:hypothetical protein
LPDLADFRFEDFVGHEQKFAGVHAGDRLIGAQDRHARPPADAREPIS